MLEDREYMREPNYGQQRISFTVAILIVNAICYVAQMVDSNYEGLGFQYHYLALSFEGLKSGFVWQLLTFQFMHASLLHIAVNSLAIFFFGRPIEMAIGGRKFLALYFASGVIGGLVQMACALAIPSFGGPVVGASAGASGLVGAFAVMNWDQRFTLYIYFFPVNMTGKILLWLSIGLAVVGMVTPSSIANAAHLGGILTGAVFARQIIRGSFSLPSFRSEPPEYAPTRPRKKLWGSAPADEDVSPDDYVKSEVDPILDKISAHGIQSLTPRERDILEKARSKITRR
jgi:membrane associated rhomboid family serine protease